MYVLSNYRSGLTPDIGPLAGPVLEVQGGRQRGEQTEPQLVGEAGEVSNYPPSVFYSGQLERGELVSSYQKSANFPGVGNLQLTRW